MIERRRGHLFFIGSSAGRTPHANAAVYGATKAAISLFCDALRADIAGSGVRVTEICPGRVETDLYVNALGEERIAELYKELDPIQPQEIASLLLAALRMPANVNVSRFEVFPTTQSVGGSSFTKAR
jgi:3-hydroxy acid dehydrogenase / malonic semialdehyde reductase